MAGISLTNRPSKNDLAIGRKNVLDHVVENDSIPQQMKDLLVQSAAQVRTPMHNPGLDTLSFDVKRNLVSYTASGEVEDQFKDKHPWASYGTVVHKDGRLYGNLRIENSPESLKEAYLTLGLHRLAIATESIEQFESRLEHYVRHGMERKELKAFASDKVAVMHKEGLSPNAEEIKSLTSVLDRFALKEAKEYLHKVFAVKAI